MYVTEAESRFHEALQHLSRGQAREALPFISAAMDLQKQADESGFGQATYLSYHGLCLALTRHRIREGLDNCRQASKLDPFSPVIWWNLGRVALMLDRRKEAYRAFQEGLRVDPCHAGIQRDLRRMGVRRPPVLRFLSRKHPVNVTLGRLRGQREQTQGKSRKEH